MQNRPMKSAAALTSQPWQRRLNVRPPPWAVGLPEGEAWYRQACIPERFLRVPPRSCQTTERDSPKSLIWPSELYHATPNLRSRLLSGHSWDANQQGIHISWAWPLLSHSCTFAFTIPPAKNAIFSFSLPVPTLCVRAKSWPTLRPHGL